MKRKRKEVDMSGYYNDRIPTSVLHEVKGKCIREEEVGEGV